MMRIGSLIKTYSELTRDMSGLPAESALKCKLRAQRSDYLESVKERYGQDIVDIIVRDKRRLKGKSATEPTNIVQRAGLSI